MATNRHISAVTGRRSCCKLAVAALAPAGMFFNARYSKLHIGNFTEERFIDIWKSDRYWRAMNYLASPAFDAPTMMGTLPIAHYVNVALDRHVKGIERIQPAAGSKPLHVNFL